MAAGNRGGIRAFELDNFDAVCVTGGILLAGAGQKTTDNEMIYTLPRIEADGNEKIFVLQVDRAKRIRTGLESETKKNLLSELR